MRGHERAAEPVETAVAYLETASLELEEQLQASGAEAAAQLPRENGSAAPHDDGGSTPNLLENCMVWLLAGIAVRRGKLHCQCLHFSPINKQIVCASVSTWLELAL